jgi:hypothetical protein
MATNSPNVNPYPPIVTPTSAPFSYFDKRISPYDTRAILNQVAQFSPITYPANWDFVQINGMVSPGYCVVTGFKRDWGWDHKHGKGAQGHVSTYTGMPLAKGQIDFYLWTEYQYIYWGTQFQANFLYDPTKLDASPQNAAALSQFAFQMNHPSLSGLLLHQFVTRSISQLESVSEKDPTFKRVTVELDEFRPPPPVAAVVTPKQATPDFVGPPAPPALTPDQQLAANLQAQIAKQWEATNQP